MGDNVTLKEILLAIYGCNLNHSDLSDLVKNRLGNFEIAWGNPSENANEKRNILVQMDVYDVSMEMNRKSGDIYFHQYLISEDYLNAFENALSNLNVGFKKRCHLNARGHIEVEIDNTEYSARTLVTLDNETIIYFLDEEAEANKYIRPQLYRSPSELHYLTLNYKLSYEERKTKVQNWIEQILLNCK